MKDLYEELKGSNHQIYSNVLTHIGLVYFEMGDYKEGSFLTLPPWQYFLSPSRTLFHTNPIAFLVWPFRVLTIFHQAESYFKESYGIRKKNLPEFHLHVALASYDLALVFWQQAQLSNALYLLGMAITVMEKNVGHDHPALALLQNTFKDIAQAVASTSKPNGDLGVKE